MSSKMSRKIKLRALSLGALFTLLFFALIWKVFVLQVVEAADLMDKARRAWETSRQLEPKRGTIYDRNGNILAQDAPAYTVAVNPDLIHRRGVADEVVDILARLLDMDRPADRQRLNDMVRAKNRDGRYLYQKEIRNEGWKIDSSRYGDFIKTFGSEREMNAMGVYLLEETKRYYPYGSTAAHVLGYVDKDGRPWAGIEYRFHEWMKGTPGSILYKKDNKGYQLPGSATLQPAVDGYDVRLTIDQNIQVYIEQAMRETYEQYNPEYMTAIAVNPHTLEVLGMANLPDYDPNRYWSFQSERDMFNSAVLAAFEPGSTFKIVTLAATVEEGLFDPAETFQSGQIRVPGHTIYDHQRSGWGEITYLEGLKRSSNVAFVKLGYEKLGKEKLEKYIRDFGFGMKTGIELPGESAGRVDLKYDADFAASTYGQGITVTALQQIAAISAIANGGNLMKPYLVKEVRDPKTGEIIEKGEPKVVRRVIREESARQTAEYLEQVIADREIGTGRRAYLEGYRMAGKTGTANVVVDGEYAQDKWIVSFIGFAPVEDPQIALIVVAAKPEVDNYLEAGQVLPNVFREIMSKSLHYLGVASTGPEGGIVTEVSGYMKVPDIVGHSPLGAENAATAHAVPLEVLGSGNEVVGQHPAAGATIGPGQKLYAFLQDPSELDPPDLTGKAMRDAVEICSVMHLQCEFEGSGFVASQEYSAEEGQRKLIVRLAPK